MSKSYFDNTMLGDYKKCPRYFYLRHRKGWRSQGISAALTFGLSWHSAMDALWQGFGKVPDEQLLEIASFAFNKTWIEEGMPDPATMDIADTESLGARTPMIAREMLHQYLEKRRPLLEDSTLLFAERPFAVPIFQDDADIWYIGRMDKGISHGGRQLILEHKTTSEYKKDGGFKTSYVEGWYPNSQCEGYLYGSNMQGLGSFQYVWIDAALVHKKEHGFFKFIPISASFANLDNWLWEVRDWISRIMEEDRRLAEAPTNESTMGAFPRNTDQCNGKYGLCPFLGICRGFNNPAIVQEPPAGYIVDRWEPFNVLGLEKIGMEKT